MLYLANINKDLFKMKFKGNKIMLKFNLKIFYSLNKG